jgi:hypothetical protein
MTIRIINNYIPLNDTYTPLKETITYENRTYRVYKIHKPLTIAKKARFIIEAIISLFQNKACRQVLEQGYQEKKFIFVNSEEFVLDKIRCHEQALQYACEDLRQNKEFNLKAIKQTAWALKYASDEIKRDKEIVFEAVKGNHDCLDCFKFAHEDLKKNKEFILKAVAERGNVLEHAHEDLKKDKDFALVATKHNPCAWQFVHEDLKHDKEFCLEVVKQNGLALKYMPENVQKDKDVVVEAVKQNEWAFEYAHDDLKKDKKFVLKIIKLNVNPLQYVHDDLKKDKVFLLEVLKQEAMQQKSIGIFRNESLKRDREFALEVVTQNHGYFVVLHKDLQNDKYFVLEALRRNGLVLQHISRYLKNDDLKDKALTLEAVKQNGLSLQFAHPDLQQDRDVALAAVQSNGLALRYVNFIDPEIIETAHQLLHNQLQIWLEDPEQAQNLFLYSSCIVNHSKKFYLHEEHPLLQKAIDIFCLTSPNDDPKNAYRIYSTLQKTIQEEPLIDDFEGFRKRADKKSFTFGDIPNEIIPLHTLFESIEQKGVLEQEVADLCGASFQEVKNNVLGEGKAIPLLLAQKGKQDDPLPLTVMYLYAILKCISDADDTRVDNHLSARESQLLKFASMIKECATGQADAIEQYYINTIGIGALNSSQSKIEQTIDQTIQMALKKALASDVLLRQLMGKEPVQQSHQTLYLQNRYHKQIGLIHTLRFDRHTGVIDSTLLEKSPQETLALIKQHLHLVQETKQVLDQSLVGSLNVKITYMEFIAYFEKEFGVTSDKYAEYVEFDEEMSPKGITPFAVEQMLKKLEYIK